MDDGPCLMETCAWVKWDEANVDREEWLFNNVTLYLSMWLYLLCLKLQEPIWVMQGSKLARAEIKHPRHTENGKGSVVMNKTLSGDEFQLYYWLCNWDPVAGRSRGSLGLISVLNGLSIRTCIFTSLGDDNDVSLLKYYVPVCPSGRKEVVEVSCDYRTSYFSDEVGGAGGYMDETYTSY